MKWIWDTEKNKSNRQKHGLSFETAKFALSDPLAVTRLDSYSSEERWQTVGLVGQLIVLVVHTWPRVTSNDGEGTGRIISARKATIYERRAYEEGTF